MRRFQRSNRMAIAVGLRYHRPNWRALTPDSGVAMELKELMRPDVLTVDEQMPVGQLLDLMTAAHVHSAPVVGADGELIGIVSQEDILVGGLGSGGSRSPPT